MDAVRHVDDENELITGEAVALDLRPAGFVLRAGSAAIDFVIYLGSYILVLLLAFQAATAWDVDEAAAAAIGIAAFVVCVIAAPTAVELLMRGKSVGRLALGVRIVRDDGGAIGFRHAFLRALVGVLEIYMTLGGIAAVVALLNGRTKRLGDLLAGTYAQHERIPKVVDPVYGVPLELTAWSRTADVARMPDGLSRRIAQFLKQAGGMAPGSRVRLARELANEASRFVSPVPAADPELFLAAVAAMRREREFAALTLQQQRLDRLEPVLQGLPHGFPDR